MNKILKAKIVEKHGSQFQFSLAIGEHEASISRIVRGRRVLDPEQQKKWAAALDVDDPRKIFEPEAKE